MVHVKKSLELQWLEILSERCKPNPYLQRRLCLAQLGYQGEKDFADLASAYIPDHWALLHDLTFKRAGRHLQIDFVLVTPHTLLVLEIKNFQVHYRLEGSKLVGDKGTVFRNIFYQVENGIDYLKTLLGSKFPVEGQLVFMSDQNRVDFAGQYTGDYLKRWQVGDYFNQIKAKQSASGLDVARLAQFLQDQSLPSHEGIDFLGRERLSDLRGGLICEVCQSSQLNRYSKSFLQCSHCGHMESQGKAIYRTICDYAVLNYNKSLRLQDLAQFMDGQVNYKTLSRYFREYKASHKLGRLAEHYPYQDLPFPRKSCKCSHCRDKGWSKSRFLEFSNNRCSLRKNRLDSRITLVVWEKQPKILK